MYLRRKSSLPYRLFELMISPRPVKYVGSRYFSSAFAAPFSFLSLYSLSSSFTILCLFSSSSFSLFFCLYSSRIAIFFWVIQSGLLKTVYYGCARFLFPTAAYCFACCSWTEQVPLVEGRRRTSNEPCWGEKGICINKIKGLYCECRWNVSILPSIGSSTFFYPHSFYLFQVLTFRIPFYFLFFT